MDHLDTEILKRLQGDLSLEAQPFLGLAEEIGAAEADVLNRVEGLKNRGIIRRLGAILYHRRSGINGNAMVVWRVPEAEIDRVGETFARYKEITHCYSRNTKPDWPYNLYTMIHAANLEGCAEIAKGMAQQVGISDYLILQGIREFKKTSMKYF